MKHTSFLYSHIRGFDSAWWVRFGLMSMVRLDEEVGTASTVRKIAIATIRSDLNESAWCNTIGSIWSDRVVLMWPLARFDLIESTLCDTIGSIWSDWVDLCPSAPFDLIESTWCDTISSIWSDRVDLKLIEFWRRYNFIRLGRSVILIF